MYHPNIKQETGDIVMDNDVCAADKLIENIITLLIYPQLSNPIEEQIAALY